MSGIDMQVLCSSCDETSQSCSKFPSTSMPYMLAAHPDPYDIHKRRVPDEDPLKTKDNMLAYKGHVYVVEF